MHNPLIALVLVIFIVAACGEIARGAGLLYTGVNLAGAEFGPTPTPGNLGTFGTNYTYPTPAEVDYYIGKGMDTFRLPFRWERLQPTQSGPLDSAELGRLDSFVSYATSKGAYVAIEPHNFARYYPDPANFQQSTQGLVGSAVPNSAFADFWSRLASNYKSNPHVIFNLMNEPNSMPTEQWVSASNSAIAAIRTAGASNLVLVPGNAYTGAWTWFQTWYGTRNATAMLNIVDPANNYAYDVHQYLDSDGSGTSATIFNNDPTIGVQRLTAFTDWLKANNRRGFLGEFAVANSTIGSGASQIGDETLINMLDYIDANSDVWLGWTWWAGGPWWNNYMFTLDPTNLGAANQADRAAMAVLQPYFTSVPEPTSIAALGISAAMLLSRRRANCQ
ncbi:MAG TPA: cellulase family glycosylhydrolase [Tepidisphaeraceae bacterium]|nr:cellulase family glycosylhydrolase [Tepidisphaeraceae bacterium]